ncbi:hypothetical protein RB2150_17714 [Rhodobacterales bacterium HTCC2150]|nr:hypothetical protein RB2150_17714 [Rhodobacterales bacterium HTCC2150] [Rhodobacteraceae bacterium HTCC2150]
MRAWDDHIARQRITFPLILSKYVDLATDKTTYVATTTGETPILGDLDFVSPSLRDLLEFSRKTDVQVIAVDITASQPAA